MIKVDSLIKILENSRSYEVENKIIPIKKIINLISND